MATASVYRVEFQHPMRAPGYGGFTPTIQFSNGCTYGAATKRYYESSKLEGLSTSVISVHKKNNYSSVNKSKPAGNNNPYPNYTLSHTGNRRLEVLGFDDDAQTHRQQYKDHTGTLPRVGSFTHRRIASAPTTRMDRWVAVSREHSLCDQLPPLQLVTSYDQTILYSNRIRPASSQMYSRRTSALERATRDQFFQKR
ncbi:ciliary microtubule inner protein 2C-like [Dysidea avara]|uniref:ciliary microtubule inner protein 2C-like n=1 Tax=Dysidea avara TaxID=196820 RepID=UPI00331F8C55